MGRDLAEASAAARLVFEEVDDALSQSLSRLMFDGPGEELTLTENAQPALMAVSMAVLRTLEEAGLAWPRRRASWPAIRSANIRRCARPAPFPSPTPPGCSRRAAGRCRRRCRSATARWPPCSARPWSRRKRRGRGGGGRGVRHRQRQRDRPGRDQRPCRRHRPGDRGGAGHGRAPRHEIAGERALPLQPDAAGRRRHGRRTGTGAAGHAGRAADRQRHGAGGERRPDDRRPAGAAGHRPGALAREHAVRPGRGLFELVELGAGKVLATMARRIDPDLTGTAVNSPDDIDTFLAAA